MNNMKKVPYIITEVCNTILVIVILLTLLVITLFSTVLSFILLIPISVIILILTQVEKIKNVIQHNKDDERPFNG